MITGGAFADRGFDVIQRVAAGAERASQLRVIRAYSSIR